jgi:hypothetical protein
MSEADEHLEHIRRQFGRQADAYVRLRHTTDERSLNGLVLLSGADADSRVLDVACGPGFLTMAFAARCRRAIGFDATERFLAMARIEAQHRGLRNASSSWVTRSTRSPTRVRRGVLPRCRSPPRPERVLAEMARVWRWAGASSSPISIVGRSSAGGIPQSHGAPVRPDACAGAGGQPTSPRSLPVSEWPCASRLTYDSELEEWIAHGGRRTAARIRQMMGIDRDRCCGLNVRRQDSGVVHHRAAAFVLRHAT